jgi:hypothetical protein
MAPKVTARHRAGVHAAKDRPQATARSFRRLSYESLRKALIAVIRQPGESSDYVCMCCNRTNRFGLHLTPPDHTQVASPASWLAAAAGATPCAAS